MDKPVRIQRSRQHKQVSPNGLPIVYVGRPSKWGNIYAVDGKGIKTPEFAIHCFSTWIDYLLQYKPGFLDNLKIELKGKNLSCWCKIGEPCHADILLELANKNQ